MKDKVATDPSCGGKHELSLNGRTSRYRFVFWGAWLSWYAANLISAQVMIPG